MSSFFLVYSNRNYDPCQNIDYFYKQQEENGAIRWKYDLKTNQPVLDKENPDGVGLPLFAFAEYNLYHKSANKRRIKDVMPNLQKYMDWLMTTMNRRLLILELGVGMNYPTVIRFPFEKLTYVNNRARMIRVHNKLYQLTKEISEKSQGVQMNSIDFIMQESDG